MFNIFADTHKLIALEIHANVKETYNIDLNKEKLLWGSVAPDILPKYRFIRHYQEESLNYITLEIMKIIVASRFLDFEVSKDSLALNILSQKIGVISHYLSDYTCLPHASRWTFFKAMSKHVRYESRLNEYAPNHTFKSNLIRTDNLDISEGNLLNLNSKIKNYIKSVIKEYAVNESFSNDLNFALALNLKITYFILDCINEYSQELHEALAFQI